MSEPDHGAGVEGLGGDFAIFLALADFDFVFVVFHFKPDVLVEHKSQARGVVQGWLGLGGGRLGRSVQEADI